MRWTGVGLAMLMIPGCASGGATRPPVDASPAADAPPPVDAHPPPAPGTPFTGWQAGPAPDGSLPAETFRAFVREQRPDLRHDPWRAAEVATGVSADEAARVSLALEKRAGPEPDAPLAPEGSHHVVVVVTMDGLLDDAIAGIRHELSFALENGAWQLVSARMTCRSARPGSATAFSPEACFGP
jgi:hypothetical protein